MPASLQKCPLEIVRQIVQLLDLNDVRNLRLTGRQMSMKATDDTFRSRFRTKYLPLTQNNLENFVQVTRPGRLGCLLENLLVTAPAIDTKYLETIFSTGAKWITQGNGPLFRSEKHMCTPEELIKVKHDIETLENYRTAHTALSESGLDINLLTTAFKNLATNTEAERLKSIWMWSSVYSKDADSTQLPIKGGDWNLISQKLAYVFRTVMLSLSLSSLHVETLDVASEVLRCSLSTDDLESELLSSVHLQKSFSELKSLSISLFIGLAPDPAVSGNSEHMSTLEAGGGYIMTREDPPPKPSGLSKLLNLMPQLEEFDLHWYSKGANKTEDPETERIFQEIVKTTKLNKLARCRLRGFAVDEESLLAFIKKYPITLLKLEELRLRNGTFERFLQHCTSDNAAMEHIYFDDVYEGGRLLYFDEPGGEPKFPSMNGSHGTNTLERNGEDVRRPIRYHFATGRPLGSPQAYRWRNLRRQIYGPP